MLLFCPNLFWLSMSYCTQPLILSENTPAQKISENLSKQFSFICVIGGPCKNRKNTFKGYLCYKTINSQNVSSEVQVKNLLFRRKCKFRSEDIQVFVFLIIPWSLLSWWILVHETGCIFEYNFWTTSH